MLDHVPGLGDHNDYKSLPLDYEVEGTLFAPITIGECVRLARDVRNGVKAEGIFVTSPVTEITATSFSTKNSIYDFTVL